MPRTPATAALLLLALGAAGALHGQRTEHGAFVTRDSTGDTLALEVYSRAGNRLQGRMVQHEKGSFDERIWRDSTGGCHTFVARVDAQTISTWHRLTLRPDGSISRFELAADSAFSHGLSAEFDHDSVTLRSRGLGRADTAVRAAAPAPASLRYASIAVMEQLVRHARNQGRDSAAFSWYDPEDGRVAPLSVISLGGDSVRMNGKDGEWRVRVDARGRLLRLDASELNGPGAVAERVRGPLDLDRFHAASLAYDGTWQRPRQSTPEEVRARCDASRPPAGQGPPPSP